MGWGDALEHCPLNWVLAHIISPKPALTQRQTTNELWAAEDAACKRGEEGVRGSERGGGGWGERNLFLLCIRSALGKNKGFFFFRFQTLKEPETVLR